MKGILSYRFTGEDPKELEPILQTVHDSLLKLGFSEIFCSLFLEEFFNEKQYTIEQRYAYCLDAQNDKDTFIAFLRSEAQSTGVKKEFAKAIELHQKIILIIKEGIEQFHPEIVQAAGTSIITFKTEGDLATILSTENPDISNIFAK